MNCNKYVSYFYFYFWSDLSDPVNVTCWAFLPFSWFFAMALRRSKSLFGTDRPPAEDGYLDPIALRKVYVIPNNYQLTYFMLRFVFLTLSLLSTGLNCSSPNDYLEKNCSQIMKSQFDQSLLRLKKWYDLHPEFPTFYLLCLS